MPIERLRELSSQQLPLDVSDKDQIDELRVLLTAGLIAGLRLSRAAAPDGTCSGVIRVLAITPNGRRLLQRTSCYALPAAP